MVEAHDDHFPERTKDVDLLPKVGQKGWVMLTEDRRIRYRAAERQAYLDAGLRMFALATGNLSTDKKLEVLLSAEKRVREVLEREPAPFTYRIAKDGKLLRLE